MDPNILNRSRFRGYSHVKDKHSVPVKGDLRHRGGIDSIWSCTSGNAEEWVREKGDKGVAGRTGLFGARVIFTASCCTVIQGTGT